MSADGLFETETMAELYARQGQVADAVAIYRRLCAASAASAEQDHARLAARLAELEGKPADASSATDRAAVRAAGPSAQIDPAIAARPSLAPALVIPPSPGVVVVAAGDEVAVAWALPEHTTAPTLELFCVVVGSQGIETNKSVVPLTAVVGRLSVYMPGVRSAMAAVGTTTEASFLPLARSTRQTDQ